MEDTRKLSVTHWTGRGEERLAVWQCRNNLLETLTLSRPDFLDTWRMKSTHKNVLFGVRNKKLRRLMTCNYVILPNGYHLGSAILDFWISPKKIGKEPKLKETPVSQQ